MKTYCHCGGRYDLIRHLWYGQQRYHECDNCVGVAASLEFA